MKNIDPVIKRLKDIDEEFYGQVVILVRKGRAVRVEEQRVFQLDKEEIQPMSPSRQVPQGAIAGIRQGCQEHWILRVRRSTRC